jgi:predicted nucleotidyltransferase component of viral defense system
MVHMIFDTESTDGLRRIRIKIETNIRETDSCFDRIARPFRVSSSWWSGEAQISTFDPDELMGTKLRALYQRSKGRDLFDLWHVLIEADANDERIIQAFNHYVGDDVFTYSDLAANLAEKLADPDFAGDLNELVTAPPADYKLAAAADVVMERLASRLAAAPDPDEIRGGRWRAASTRT